MSFAGVTCRRALVPVVSKPLTSRPPTTADLGKSAKYCVQTKRRVNLTEYSDSPNASVVACYGCGEEGVDRSECLKCNAHFSGADFTISPSILPRMHKLIGSVTNIAPNTQVSRTTHSSSSLLGKNNTSVGHLYKTCKQVNPSGTMALRHPMYPELRKTYSNEKQENLNFYAPEDFASFLPRKYFINTCSRG